MVAGDIQYCYNRPNIARGRTFSTRFPVILFGVLGRHLFAYRALTLLLANKRPSVSSGGKRTKCCRLLELIIEAAT